MTRIKIHIPVVVVCPSYVLLLGRGAWQATLGFEDLNNPHYWGGSMLTSFLKHARFNSFRELKISNSIFGLGKVYLCVKHSFLLILELLEPQPVYFFRTSLCSQKGHPFNRHYG